MVINSCLYLVYTEGVDEEKEENCILRMGYGLYSLKHGAAIRLDLAKQTGRPLSLETTQAQHRQIGRGKAATLSTLLGLTVHSPRVSE